MPHGRAAEQMGLAMAIYRVNSTLSDRDNDWYGSFDIADEVHALGGDDTVHAGGGDDLVWGGFGDDHVFGGTGNDELHGDADFLEQLASFSADLGNDVLNGEEGNDTLIG